MAPRKLATIFEVADFYGVTDKTLRSWARQGKGPVPLMVSNQYRYRWDEVEAYIEGRRFKPEPVTDEPTAERCGCI